MRRIILRVIGLILLVGLLIWGCNNVKIPGIAIPGAAPVSVQGPAPKVVPTPAPVQLEADSCVPSANERCIKILSVSANHNVVVTDLVGQMEYRPNRWELTGDGYLAVVKLPRHTHPDRVKVVVDGDKSSIRNLNAPWKGDIADKDLIEIDKL